MEEHHLRVPRTARYHVLGSIRGARSIWMLLHGYGQLARYFLREFEGLEKDTALVAPEGLSRYYTDREHTRVGATWMTREDREHEIADQITYLDELARSLRTSAGQDLPINLLGFSQGVATACRWAALGQTPVRRLVLWGGTMPPELGTATLANRWSTVHVDLVHGEKDDIVPASVLSQSEARLRSAGLSYNIHHFAGAHVLDTLLLQQLIKG